MVRRFSKEVNVFLIYIVYSLGRENSYIKKIRNMTKYNMIPKYLIIFFSEFQCLNPGLANTNI